jgi:hypothetical protein
MLRREGAKIWSSNDTNGNRDDDEETQVHQRLASRRAEEVRPGDQALIAAPAAGFSKKKSWIMRAMQRPGRQPPD